MNSKEIADTLKKSDEAIRQWAKNPYIEKYLSDGSKPKKPGALRRYTEKDALVLAFVAKLRDAGHDFEAIGDELAKVGDNLGQWPPTLGDRLKDTDEEFDELEDEYREPRVTGTGLTVQQMTATIGRQQGVIETLEEERNYLRGHVQQVTERAVRAETELEILQRQGEQQAPTEAPSAPVDVSSTVEMQASQPQGLRVEVPKRSWWQRLLGR